MTRPYTLSPNTWTPERRAAQAERMRAVMLNPETNSLRLTALAASPKAKAQRVRMCEARRGIKLDDALAALAADHLRSINCDPAVRGKIAATRKCGPVPKGYKRRYRTLRDMIGASAAMAVVRREAAIARVNA